MECSYKVPLWKTQKVRKWNPFAGQKPNSRNHCIISRRASATRACSLYKQWCTTCYHQVSRKNRANVSTINFTVCHSNSHVMSCCIYSDSHTAKQITSDSRKISICIYKENDEDSRDLCMDIYSTYSEVVRNDAPAIEEFIHAIQVSSISSLYRDISEILESFEEYSRIPDTVIMTFEPLYNYLQKV